MISWTTIITTAIASLASLGGVFLGYLFSSKTNAKSHKYALELENIRITEERRKEKATRTAEALEEFFMLITNLTTDVSFKFYVFDEGPKSDVVIFEHINRMQVLVGLYLPLLHDITQKYFTSAFAFIDAYHNQFVAIEAGLTVSIPDEAIKKFESERDDFLDQSTQLTVAIKKLVE